MLAKLGDGGPQLVKVPVSDAVWSVWRRYCRLAGVSMGRGLAVLLARELTSTIGEDESIERVLADRAASHTEALEERVVDLERHLMRPKRTGRKRDQQVRSMQRLLAEEQLAIYQAHAAPGQERVGRNERCPCGSGLKYKFCELMNHRLSAR